MTNKEWYELGDKLITEWEKEIENYLSIMGEVESLGAKFVESVRKQAYINFAKSAAEITRDGVDRVGRNQS